jgi:hypothetical protein
MSFLHVGTLRQLPKRFHIPPRWGWDGFSCGEAINISLLAELAKIMQNRLTSKTILTVAVTLAAQFIFAIAPARAQLDETCKITCNGQTVDVGYGGEYTIYNIPAGPDLFRVYALCTKDGKTRYGRSGFVQIIDQRTFVISELDMLWRDTPFPTPRFINARADNPVLGLLGQTTQVRVIRPAPTP